MAARTPAAPEQAAAVEGGGGRTASGTWNRSKASHGRGWSSNNARMLQDSVLAARLGGGGNVSVKHTASGPEITIEVKQSRDVVPPLVEASLQTRMQAAATEKERQQAWINKGQLNPKVVTDPPIRSARRQKRKAKRERERVELLHLRSVAAQAIVDSALNALVSTDAGMGTILSSALAGDITEERQQFVTYNLPALEKFASNFNPSNDHGGVTKRNPVIFHDQSFSVTVYSGTVAAALTDEALGRTILLGLLCSRARDVSGETREVLSTTKHKSRFETLFRTLYTAMPIPETTPQLKPAPAASLTAMEDEGV